MFLLVSLVALNLSATSIGLFYEPFPSPLEFPYLLACIYPCTSHDSNHVVCVCKVFSILLKLLTIITYVESQGNCFQFILRDNLASFLNFVGTIDYSKKEKIKYSGCLQKAQRC